MRVAQRILEAIKPPFHFDHHELHVTMSIGITLYPYDGEDADTLLKNADTALYRAKEQGRNNYQLYTPAMNARAFERLALENSLRKALERREFSLVLPAAGGHADGRDRRDRSGAALAASRPGDRVPVGVYLDRRRDGPHRAAGGMGDPHGLRPEPGLAESRGCRR